MSEDPYHTEFVSWRVDHFCRFFNFFSTIGGGVRRLVENSTNLFFEPYPNPEIVSELISMGMLILVNFSWDCFHDHFHNIFAILIQV